MSLALPPPPPVAPGAAKSYFEPLFKALIKCLLIIAAGYSLRRLRIFSPSNTEGVSAFVARVALPALVLLKMATLDLSVLAESAFLVSSILAAKSVLFLIMVAGTFITSLRPSAGSLLASPPLPRGRSGALSSSPSQ